MENAYYVLAHGQASKERADLRTQIEKLLVRDAKLEKLVDCLKEFLPEAEAKPEGANGHAADAPAAEAHAEIHSADGHNAEGHEGAQEHHG
jgi:hypothetical protein